MNLLKRQISKLLAFDITIEIHLKGMFNVEEGEGSLKSEQK